MTNRKIFKNIQEWIDLEKAVEEFCNDEKTKCISSCEKCKLNFLIENGYVEKSLLQVAEEKYKNVLKFTENKYMGRMDFKNRSEAAAELIIELRKKLND